MSHGDVLPLRPPAAGDRASSDEAASTGRAPKAPAASPASADDTTSFVGMVVFLASWAMLFGALFFAYGYLRTHARSWPPAGMPSFPVWPGLANTAVLALSSGALHAALRALRQGRPRAVTPSVLAAFGLGLVFVAGQALLWRALTAAGLPMAGTGTYGAVFYALTGLHALHVAVGLLGLLGVAWAAHRGSLSRSRQAPLRLWAMYWHFVGAVWLVLFVTVFCL